MQTTCKPTSNSEGQITCLGGGHNHRSDSVITRRFWANFHKLRGQFSVAHQQFVLPIKELPFTEPTSLARAPVPTCPRAIRHIPQLHRVACAFLFTGRHLVAAVRLALALRPPSSKVTSSQCEVAWTTSISRSPHVIPRKPTSSDRVHSSELRSLQSPRPAQEDSQAGKKTCFHKLPSFDFLLC